MRYLMLLICIVMFSLPALGAPPGFDEAVTQYRAGKFSQALAQLETMQASGDPYVHYYMGLCFHNLNQVNRAQQEYQWVLSNANSPGLKHNAELGLQSLGKYASSRNREGSAPAASYSGGRSSGGGHPKMIDFYAEWCGPCKRIAPFVEQKEEEYRGRVDFQRVDIDQEEQLAGKFKIRAVPTFVFFDGSGRVVHRVEGASTQGIEQGLQKLVQ